MVTTSGWIKLHRRFLSWEWFTKPDMVSLFVYLLLSANREDNEWRGVLIKRGQLLTSVASLSANTGISVQTVRNNLNRMKSTNEITIKSTNKYSIITICNYERYQIADALCEQTNEQTNEHSINKQPNNKQEYKKKRIKNIPTTTTLSVNSFSHACARECEDGEPFTMKSLSKDELAKERRAFYEIFFLAGATRPDQEVRRFIQHNEKFGWRSHGDATGKRMTFATFEQRTALAHEWSRNSLFQRADVSREVLDIWAQLYHRVLPVRPDLRGALTWRGAGLVLMAQRKTAMVFCEKALSDYLSSDGKEIIASIFQEGWSFEYLNKFRPY